MDFFRAVPAYAWTLLALTTGITFGGFFPDISAPVAEGTSSVIKFVVRIVPLLIFAALSPAFATLVKRGLAGKFASSVILWFVISSTFAGLIGVIISSLFFKIPVSSGSEDVWTEAVKMFQSFKEGGASHSLLAIIAAVFSGFASAWIKPFYNLLVKIGQFIGKAGQILGYILIPILLCFGVTLGVSFGAKIGMGYFFSISFFTFSLCLLWCLFYIFGILRWFAKIKSVKLLTEYFFPTAIFAAGTVSSLVTFPVNLINIKKIGVRDEVADFVISFGAVANMNGSALVNIAFAPFLLSYVFGVEISWMVMLIAWPAVVLFTIAAPGLPAGMGTALWASTLFTSMLGLEDPVRSTVITTWVALYGGLPDMFITAANCTGDGFSAALFDKFFDRYVDKDS